MIITKCYFLWGLSDNGKFFDKSVKDFKIYNVNYIDNNSDTGSDRNSSSPRPGIFLGGIPEPSSSRRVGVNTDRSVAPAMCDST